MGELSHGLCCGTHKTCTSTLPGVPSPSLSRSGRRTDADIRLPFPSLPPFLHTHGSRSLVPVREREVCGGGARSKERWALVKHNGSSRPTTQSLATDHTGAACATPACPVCARRRPRRGWVGVVPGAAGSQGTEDTDTCQDALSPTGYINP